MILRNKQKQIAGGEIQRGNMKNNTQVRILKREFFRGGFVQVLAVIVATAVEIHLFDQLEHGPD
jgi:hypothetical protein